jgi:hypothetical protein
MHGTNIATVRTSTGHVQHTYAHDKPTRVQSMVNGNAASSTIHKGDKVNVKHRGDAKLSHPYSLHHTDHKGVTTIHHITGGSWHKLGEKCRKDEKKDHASLQDEAARHTAHTAPPIGHEIYTKREKAAGYNGTTSPIYALDAATGGRMLRKRLPHFTKEDHIKAGDHHSHKSHNRRADHEKLSRKAYKDLQDRGVDPGPLISGIGSDKFDTETQDRLRHLIHTAGDHAKAACSHYAAGGLRSGYKRYRDIKKAQMTKRDAASLDTLSLLDTSKGPDRIPERKHTHVYREDRATKLRSRFTDDGVSKMNSTVFHKGDELTAFPHKDGARVHILHHMKTFGDDGEAPHHRNQHHIVTGQAAGKLLGKCRALVEASPDTAAAAKMRKYYSLLEMLPSGKYRGIWTIQFGDYVRSVVVEEMNEMRRNPNQPKGVKYKIICTDHKWSTVQAAIAELNKGKVAAPLIEDEDEASLDTAFNLRTLKNWRAPKPVFTSDGQECVYSHPRSIRLKTTTGESTLKKGHRVRLHIGENGKRHSLVHFHDGAHTIHKLRSDGEAWSKLRERLTKRSDKASVNEDESVLDTAASQYWAKQGRKQTGPHKSHEEALEHFRKEHPTKDKGRKSDIMTGYGSDGPFNDLRWHNCSDKAAFEPTDEHSKHVYTHDNSTTVKSASLPHHRAWLAKHPGDAKRQDTTPKHVSSTVRKGDRLYVGKHDDKHNWVMHFGADPKHPKLGTIKHKHLLTTKSAEKLLGRCKNKKNSEK